jgi:ketosteroid isomerase-like protein
MTNSNANIAIIDEIYAAYNESNTAPLMNALAGDFEMHEHAPDSLPWGGVWKGRDGMVDFLAKVTGNMAHQEYVCEGRIGRDDIVTSWGHFKTQCKKTHQIVEGCWMHRIVFRGGKIIAIHEFLDSLNVAEAFGLASLTETVNPEQGTTA